MTLETTGDEGFCRVVLKGDSLQLESLYHPPTFGNEVSENDFVPPFWHRILCHIVVNRIPDEGLPDLIDSLKDVYQFHQNWGDSSHVRQLETTGPIQAHIVSQYEREPFTYEES